MTILVGFNCVCVKMFSTNICRRILAPTHSFLSLFPPSLALLFSLFNRYGAEPTPNEFTVHYEPGSVGLGFAEEENVPGVSVLTVAEGSHSQQDGRIKQGQRIMAVNGVDISNATQEEAVEAIKAATEDHFFLTFAGTTVTTPLAFGREFKSHSQENPLNAKHGRTSVESKNFDSTAADLDTGDPDGSDRFALMRKWNSRVRRLPPANALTEGGKSTAGKDDEKGFQRMKTKGALAASLLKVKAVSTASRMRAVAGKASAVIKSKVGKKATSDLGRGGEEKSQHAAGVADAVNGETLDIELSSDGGGDNERVNDLKEDRIDAKQALQKIERNLKRGRASTDDVREAQAAFDEADTLYREQLSLLASSVAMAPRHDSTELL